MAPLTMNPVTPGSSPGVRPPGVPVRPPLPNPLDRNIVGHAAMPDSWSETTQASALGSAYLAALEGLPADEKLPAGWALFLTRSAEDFREGKPVNQVVKLKDGRRLAYTFQQRSDGSVTVKRHGELRVGPASAGFTPQATSDEMVAAVRKRWEPQGFRFEGPWNSGDLLKLHKALLTLTPAELALLQGLFFRRGGADPERAGVYETEGWIAGITYFDGAFSHDDATFVGDGEPYSAGTLYHEIGHALLATHDVTLFHRLDRAISAYNGVIERFNKAATADEQTRMQPELERARKVWEEANARFVHGSDARYFEERFAGHVPPTKYSEKNASEYHAEAYWLYKTEPARLREFDKDLYDYFASGDYLRHWVKDGAGKWQVVPVGPELNPPAQPGPVLAPPREIPPQAA
ncbi:MAG: hypothetical protein FJZ01_11920 [Candidatus Sericytochromatia bacterium]|nr:hypothetical protein [Candidatus Tanganyikabacteria bacterium]